jgi:hypothetical protein
MRIEVIACNRCETVLGPPRRFDLPTVNPRDVYDAEDETLEMEFADGWLMSVFPAIDDPIALTIWHECPDCWE